MSNGYTPGRELPPDVFIDQQQTHARQQPPNQVDELVAKLANAVRMTNITAAPPAHIKPTVWSNPVDQSGSISLPDVVGGWNTVVSFRCPPGRWARIESFGMNVRDNTYSYNGSILWRFLINGIPVPQGLESMAQQRGSIVNQRPVNLILTDHGQNGNGTSGRGDLLEFQVQRAAVFGAGAQTVEMAFSGWTWRLRNSSEGTQGSVTAY